MSSPFKPGDMIELECGFYLYELVDDYGLIFYIGISRDPASRFRSHANPRHCDSEAVCEEISLQKAPRMRIVAVFPTKEQALDAEAARVRETPGVLNSVAKYALTKKRSAEYYRERRKKRALRTVSKVQEMASIGGVRPAPCSRGA